MKHPDPQKHLIFSLLKSIIRIIGYVFIPIDLITATFILVLSELIGIAEELV